MPNSLCTCNCWAGTVLQNVNMNVCGRRWTTFNLMEAAFLSFMEKYVIIYLFTTDGLNMLSYRQWTIAYVYIISWIVCHTAHSMIILTNLWLWLQSVVSFMCFYLFYLYISCVREFPGARDSRTFSFLNSREWKWLDSREIGNNEQPALVQQSVHVL